jgi:hypothetical protein
MDIIASDNLITYIMFERPPFKEITKEQAILILSSILGCENGIFIELAQSYVKPCVLLVDLAKKAEIDPSRDSIIPDDYDLIKFINGDDVPSRYTVNIACYIIQNPNLEARYTELLSQMLLEEMLRVLSSQLELEAEQAYFRQMILKAESTEEVLALTEAIAEVSNPRGKKNTN